MRKLVLALLAAVLLCRPVLATDALSDRFDTGSLEQALPEDAAALLDGADVDTPFSEGLWRLVKNTLSQLDGPLWASLRCAAVLLAVVLLCALVETPAEAEGPQAVRLAGILAICAAGALQVRGLVQLGQQALDEVQSFADLLLPVMTAATAATGGYTAASALSLGTSLFLDVLLHCMTGLLVPGVYLFLGLSAANAASGSELLDSAAGLVKWLLGTGLKILLTVFTAYLTITGIVTGTADATAVKTAKLALGGVVPVVGSMISDASEAVVVSAGLVRNSVGVFGMLAVLAICAVPFLRTALSYLILRVTGALCGTLACKAHMALLEALSDAMGLLLAMTGTAAVLLLISCVCYLRVSPL